MARADFVCAFFGPYPPPMPKPPTFSARAPGDPRPRMIAIDWGTTSLRGVRINAQGHITDQRALPQGILQVAPGGFADAFAQHFGDWLAEGPQLCLLSGMVGSRQGWQEAPYCPCPADFAALCSQLLWLDNPQGVPTAIVPGMSSLAQHQVDAVQGVPDVMRGEEIQVIGALRLMGSRDGLFLLPGTHSKWVQAQGGTITGFKTFMTGELFALLAQHSILGKTLDSSAALDEAAFIQGLERAQSPDSLSHLLFGTRALSLFGALDPAQSASYLSGLLIGQELHTMPAPAGSRVAVIGSSTLVQRYSLALRHVGCEAVAFGDEATWAGHHAIYDHLTQTTTSTPQSPP